MKDNKIRCKICGDEIVGIDYFKGINFIHHRICHIRVYGLEFND